MATDQLLHTIETAFQTLLLDFLPPGTNVYTGKASSNKKLPCVIVAADGDGEEDPPHTGNFSVTVMISVKSTAATEQGATADPKAYDVALQKSVFDIIKVPNLDSLINALGLDLTIFPTGFFFQAPKSGWDERGSWVDEMGVRIYCCPSAIPA